MQEQANVIWRPQPTTFKLTKKDFDLYLPNGQPYRGDGTDLVSIGDELRQIRSDIPSPQEVLVHCPFRLIGFGGARGGGKTDGVLGKYGIKQERYGKFFNAVFFRREMPGADDLIDRARELYEPLGATFNKVERLFTFIKGGRLRFRPLFNDEDASKYQGQNLSDAAVEEAGNYPDKSPIFKLFGALRSATGVPAQLILTFNPGGAGHYWLRELFVKPARMGMKTLTWKLPTGKEIPYIYIPSRVGDNPILLAQDPHYIDALHMVGSPELVRAWLEGDFEIHEGSYFPEFGQRHIIAPFSMPKHWPKYCGFDWGYNSPFCAVWGAVSSGKDDAGNEVAYPKGSIIIYREYTGKGIDNEQMAEKIATLSKGENCHMVADTQIFNNMGGKSIADQFRDVFNNFPGQSNWRPADKDRINGWQQVRMRLGRAGSVPMIYFFSNCRYLLDTLPGLSIDLKKPEDLDTTGNDHGADALRYLLMERQMESQYKDVRKPSVEKGVVKIAEYIQDYRNQMNAPRI